MITDPEPGQTEAPLTTALGVFRIALVTFAREVVNRDQTTPLRRSRRHRLP